MKQRAPYPEAADQAAAASLSFFRPRALIRTVAGFASNQRSSPVNGSLPKRRFFAGTCCTLIFSIADSVNSPAPFLWTAPRMVSSSAARTALAAFGSTLDFRTGDPARWR